jgi:flavin-dependent dehydrogenase
MIQKEVIIVGGGPGGSACARLLSQARVDCLLLDKQVFPRMKPCAGWITPHVLSDLGLNPADYPLSISTFNFFLISLRGLKFKIPTHQFAIRRVEFDDWLLKRSGVDVVQHQVKEIIREEDGYLIDGEYYCKYIVGAGGTYCPVRKILFNEQPGHRPENQVVAMEEEFLYPDADDRCHLWFLENGLPGYSWYVPKAGGYVNVGVGGKASVLKQNKDIIRRHWDLITKQIDQMGLVRGHDYQPLAHTYYLRHTLKELRNGNASLVGDSAGLATPDMGEGIGASIRSGMEAAESIISGKEYKLSGVPRFSFWSILTARG